MRIVVIGDVHANLAALAAALSAADSDGYDQLVFLGDLLTYGADVVETIDLVSNRLKHRNTILLRGNHDLLYSELLDGSSSYANHLPEWIKESVMWTLDRLPIDRWLALPFRHEYQFHGVLFSHANPFGPRRWDYLNTEADHLPAVEALQKRGFCAGVFGHTHRVKWYRHNGELGGFERRYEGEMDKSAIHILNAGSIGQPRDLSNFAPHLLRLTLSKTSTSYAVPSFRFERFDYDLADHMRSVNASGLSRHALARIVGFFDRSKAKPFCTVETDPIFSLSAKER